jgi:hypothetical protein
MLAADNTPSTSIISIFKYSAGTIVGAVPVPGFPSVKKPTVPSAVLAGIAGAADELSI